MHEGIWTCERTDPAGVTTTRTFDEYSDARDFVMREGDRSRLWSIEPSAEAERLNEAAWDRHNDDGRDFTAPYEP